MKRQSLHDGSEDRLTPLESLELEQVSSCADLVRAMSKTAFGGRQLGRALDVVLAMYRDSGCRVVLTVSGAMTVAKQGTIICDMIDRGLVHAVVATGALIAHGLTESIGRVHYEYSPAMSDEQLFAQGYNRIYDTLEMEANLNDVELLMRDVLDHHQPSDGMWSSAQLCRAIGAQLAVRDEGRGILRSAYEHGVPVFIPALTDSEIGLDMSIWAMRRTADKLRRRNEKPTLEKLLPATPQYNPFRDLQEYAAWVRQVERLGIFTVGGGVPRNWAQQIAPYFDILLDRLGVEESVPRFQYGVRICPEPVHWGGLSGCTYSEGISWGKFAPASEGGMFAEVLADATVAWPLLMKAVFEVLFEDR